MLNMKHRAVGIRYFVFTCAWDKASYPLTFRVTATFPSDRKLDEPVCVVEKANSMPLLGFQFQLSRL
jgi:hypothetical protein